MSIIINDEILNEIREKVNIVDLISEYVNLKKSGSNYLGLCPFHHEKTPSFSVSDEKGIFKCFGCGVGGDHISFIMKIENLGFIEAVKFLADKYNIQLGEYSEADKKLKEKKERCYSVNKEVAKFYFNNIRRYRHAYGYLLNRGINNDVITKYAIGYADDKWDSLYKYLNNLGYSDEELEEYNLISKTRKGNYIDRFRNRIIFPIIDSRSRVIGFGGRVVDDSMPKYLNTRDTPVFNKGKNLYNLNIIAKESDRSKILLVEGYMDVISLYQSGINYSVASLGTALTEYQAEIIKKYGKEVYICYDGDNAGIKATKRAIDILISKNISPKIINLKEGLDPDEYIKKYGKFQFEKELKNGINYLDYKILKIKENFNLETAEGLTGFTSETAKILAGVKNPIEQDVYVERIASKYKVSKEAIVSYIKFIQRNKIKKFGFEKSFAKENSNFIKNEMVENEHFIRETRIKAEMELIKYALDKSENYNYIIERIKPCEFRSTEVRIIYETLISNYENHVEEDVLKSLEKKKLIDDLFIKKLKGIDIGLENSEKIIPELIGTINKDQLEEELNKILKEIEALDQNESAKDNLRLRELTKKFNELNSRLKISQ